MLCAELRSANELSRTPTHLSPNLFLLHLPLPKNAMSGS